ncbi:MAG: hypothetical protein IT210_00600 [Armatimonadetes bacterium]|nr:hypothetical protein [Armatimonadota bacterium]
MSVSNSTSLLSPDRPHDRIRADFDHDRLIDAPDVGDSFGIILPFPVSLLESFLTARSLRSHARRDAAGHATDRAGRGFARVVLCHE